MSKYRKILFQHLDGIVLIPTIIALDKIGLLDLINKNKTITINDIAKKIKVNPGYLNVSLRILHCSNILKFKSGNNELEHQYTKNQRFSNLIDNIHLIKHIYTITDYHVNFNKLNDLQLTQYSKLSDDINHLLFDNKNQLSKTLYNNLEGLIIGPLLANLSFYKHLEYKSGKIQFINIKSSVKLSIIKVLKTLKFISDRKNKYQMTEKGDFFFKKSSSYGVTVSYLNTLINIDNLLINDSNYIWKRTKNNHEIHVNRSMNVWGSGGAHKTYFKKIDNIIINIFNQDISKQPHGVIDIGCGDGTFLKHIYSVIINKTIRKRYIKSHPIVLIGTDINKKAQISAKKTLKGIENIIIDGDISSPNKIDKTLNENYNLKLENFLNCRTFLDHNRIYKKPNKEIKHGIHSNGSFCFKGSLIPSYELITNFIIHLSSWKPYIVKYGLIIVELHTINPEITKNNSGNSLACAYDATHGYSDQYLIEYDVFKKCVNKAGMYITEKNEYLFPSQIPTVSINYIK